MSQSTLADYIFEHIAEISWQEEELNICADQNQLHCCLGISPSQFRRLMSTRQESVDTNEQAVVYARTAIQYALERMRFARDSCQISLMVLIVDEIQQYNYAVFNNKQIKTGVARKYALEEGDRLLKIFSEAHSQLSSELAQRVIILRWQDIHDDRYEKCVAAVRSHLLISETFRSLVDATVQHYIDVRKPNGTLSATKREILQEYVLYELPALLRGLDYDGQRYSVIIHPILTYSSQANSHQRNGLIHLLEYVRNSAVLREKMGVDQPSDICTIYDIDMPLPL